MPNNKFKKEQAIVFKDPKKGKRQVAQFRDCCVLSKKGINCDCFEDATVLNTGMEGYRVDGKYRKGKAVRYSLTYSKRLRNAILEDEEDDGGKHWLNSPPNVEQVMQYIENNGDKDIRYKLGDILRYYACRELYNKYNLK